MIKTLQKTNIIFTFLLLITYIKTEALDNAFNLEIEEGDQDFGNIEKEDIIDLNSLQTEDWKGAPKFFTFCTKNKIQENQTIHRYL